MWQTDYDRIYISCVGALERLPKQQQKQHVHQLCV